MKKIIISILIALFTASLFANDVYTTKRTGPHIVATLFNTFVNINSAEHKNLNRIILLGFKQSYDRSIPEDTIIFTYRIQDPVNLKKGMTVVMRTYPRHIENFVRGYISFDSFINNNVISDILVDGENDNTKN